MFCTDILAVLTVKQKIQNSQQASTTGYCGYRRKGIECVQALILRSLSFQENEKKADVKNF